MPGIKLLFTAIEPPRVTPSLDGILQFSVPALRGLVIVKTPAITQDPCWFGVVMAAECGHLFLVVVHIHVARRVDICARTIVNPGWKYNIVP